MQENYIHIYCSFVAKLFKENQLRLGDVKQLLEAFYPVCGKIQDRNALVEFLDTQAYAYPRLLELKQQLEDPNFVFPAAPEDL